MRKLEQRKYNICGALEKLVQGEKFAFTNYATDEEITKFSEYAESFQYIEKIKYNYNEMLKDARSKFLHNSEGFLVYYNSNSKIEASIIERSGFNQLPKPTSDEEDIIQNNFLYHFGEFIDQLDSDLMFCYGLQNLSRSYAAHINSNSATYWHEDTSPSKHLRAIFVPIGESTLYTDIDIEEVLLANENQILNAQIYNATQYELSFHYMSVCRYGTKKLSRTYSECHGKEFDGAIHKSPGTPGSRAKILDRLFMNLPACDKKCLEHLPEHLAYRQQEAMVTFNIPVDEFNWENVTLYSNENMFESDALNY